MIYILTTWSKYLTTGGWFFGIDRFTRQARGDDDHNLITIVMREYGCGFVTALEWVSGLHDDRVNKFLSTVKMVPSFGSQAIDEHVAIYIDGCGNWVRANVAWSFEVGIELMLRLSVLR